MKKGTHQEIIEKNETTQVWQGHILEIPEIKTEIDGKVTFQEVWSGGSKPD